MPPRHDAEDQFEDESEGGEGEVPEAGEDEEDRMAVSTEYAESEPALVDEVDEEAESEAVDEREAAGEDKTQTDEEPSHQSADPEETTQPTQPTSPLRTQNNTSAPDTQSDSQPTATAKGKPKAKSKEPTKERPRVPGKSLFPHSRVQKILKADKDLPTVSKEAVLLISLATEAFIVRLTEASGMYAQKEGRATVFRRDTVMAVRRADEFWFLEEIIHYADPSVSTKPAPKKKSSGKEGGLDRFVRRMDQDRDGVEEEGGPEDEGVDMGAGMSMGDGVVENEDGTMSMGA